MTSQSRPTSGPPTQGGSSRRLPTWIPWSVAAVLFFVSIWLAEQNLSFRAETMRTQDQLTITDLGLRGTRQQLEAERIINNHQIADLQHQLRQATARIDAFALREGTATQALLSKLTIFNLGPTAGQPSPVQGVVLWDSAAQEGQLNVEALPPAPVGRDYQLWVTDPQYSSPVNAGIISVAQDSPFVRRPIHPVKVIHLPTRFALSLERKNGADQLEGPIVLSSR